MKKIVVLLVAAGAPGLAAQAQERMPYKLSAQIREELAQKPAANQAAAWDYSYIGEHRAALAAWDGQPRPARRLAPADSVAFGQLRAVDARTYILERAKQERVILINEAHHNPQNRVFTASLLPELARLGFRYLALETLYETDSLLNQRGYPTLESGYYTREPQFGELLRTAMRAKMRVVAYDYGYSREGDWDTRIKARETTGARHLQQLLAADPKARIIVHCGFSHVNEGPGGMGEQLALAGQLKALTGIDPFTINQTTLSEAASPGGEEPLYRLPQATTSSVFLNAQQQPFAGADPYMSADVDVFHPRTQYRDGRPAWLFTDRRKPLAPAPPPDVTYPCLVLAYAAGEPPARAVPVDIIELQHAQDPKRLALRPGRYTLVARTQNGQTRTWQVKQ